MRRAPDVRPGVPRWSGAPAAFRSAFLLQHEPPSVSPAPASAPERFLPAQASAAQAARSARAGLLLQAFPAAASARIGPALLPASQARAAVRPSAPASPGPVSGPTA